MRRVLLRTLCWLIPLIAVALFPAAAQDGDLGEGPGEIAGISVDIHDYPGETEEIERLALDLADLRPGQPFTRELLDEAVSVLRLSGRFEKVEAITRAGPEGTHIMLRLKPLLVIRKIDVRGEYPLFRQDIVRAMTAYVGDFLVPGLPEEQAGLVRDHVLTEGFIDPEVRVLAFEEPGGGAARLEVLIDPGPYYTLDSLRVQGNRNASDAWIKRRLGVWWSSLYPGTAGRFMEKQLDEDVRALASWYWRRGYAEAETSYTLEKDPQTGEVDVIVTVAEGPRYDVSIAGNEEFWDRTLKNRLVISEEGNARGTGLRRSVRNIRSLYRENGYADARVTVQGDARGRGAGEEKLVTLSIEEGPQVTVGSVRFEGNTAFDDESLLSRMEIHRRTIPLIGKRPFDPDVLEQDLGAIRALYLQEGFSLVEVEGGLAEEEKREDAVVSIRINEGPRTHVHSVGFEGLSAITEDQALGAVSTRPGEPLRPHLLKTDEGSLAALISERGYPHVRIESKVGLNPDRTLAEVRFAVNEGPLVRMGNTYFVGNFRTRKHILNRELKMDPGDPFSLRDMITGQNVIRSMGIFQTVRYRTFGLREMRDDVVLVANLEERRPYYVQSSVGYENNLGFYGRARAGDRNLLGLNKELWAEAQASQTGERYELGLKAPRIFGTRITSLFDLYYERLEPFNQEFEVGAVGSNLGFVAPLSSRAFSSINFRYERRELSNGDLALDDLGEDLPELDRDLYEPRNVFVVTPSITYDSRDSFTRPTEGVFSTFAVDISTGLKDDLDDFLRYTFDLRAYVSPMDRLTFAWLGRAGYISSYGGASLVPEDQLFYLGGTLDVRGFDENRLLFDANGDPVGGRVSLAGSIEARVLLNYNLELALFFDTGSVRRTFDEPVAGNTRSSYGAGLRYVTPIGPVGLLYGRKLDPEPGEDAYRWHFSIGYTF